MKSRLILALPLVALTGLAACQSSADKAATAANAANAPMTPAAAGPESSAGASYAVYRGLLAGQADSITLHLVRSPSRPGAETSALAASYYGPATAPCPLYETRPAAADSLLLTEEDPAQRQPDGNYAATQWRLRRQPDGTLAGTRAGQPLRLRPARPVPAFAVLAFADSVAAYPGRPRSPYAHVGWQTLVPVAPAASVSGPVAGATAALAANILRQQRGDTLPALPVPALAACWQQQRAVFTKFYRQDVGDLATRADPADPADTIATPAYALRYDDQTRASVLCQQGSLLSLAFYTYQYAGGAHGSSNTRLASFDLRTGRALGFDDLFRPGARAALLPLLTRAVRRSLGLKSGEPLDAQLFDNKLPLTTNAALTPGGVLFIYETGELASYAQGEIRAFVPLREARPLLREGLPLPGGAGGVAAR